MIFNKTILRIKMNMYCHDTWCHICVSINTNRKICQTRNKTHFCNKKLCSHKLLHNKITNNGCNLSNLSISVDCQQKRKIDDISTNIEHGIRKR